MSRHKKRKVDNQTFSPNTNQLLFAWRLERILRSITQSSDCATEHANYASKQRMKKREAPAKRLAANLQTQQNFFHCQPAVREPHQGEISDFIKISNGQQASV